MASPANSSLTLADELSASNTSYTLRDLDLTDYVIRVVATNDGDLSSFGEYTYAQPRCKFRKLTFINYNM